jgi:hypothetical protein
MPDSDVAASSPDTASAETPAAAAVPDPSTARLTAIEQRLVALADTVQAALAPRPTVQQGAVTVDAQGLPGNYRAALKRHGVTDADIDTNAPIIVPYLRAMLETDGAVLVGGIQEVRDDIEMVKAGKNTKRYPYFAELEDQITTLRDDAQKAGRYLAVADAYRTAVALDVAGTESRIDAARSRAKADAHANATDADAQHLGANHGAGRGAARTVTRTAATAEDLAAMSSVDRRKWFATHSDLPIR